MADTEKAEIKTGSVEDISIHKETDPGPEPGGRQASEENTIDPKNEVKGIRLVPVFTAVCMLTFLVGLDLNMIATAIPIITDHFNSITDVGWYGSSFMLALCSTQPLAGKTYVLFPKKLVYLVYVGILEVGSLVCALAPTSKALIVGRAVAGLGASGIFAGGFVVVTTIIPLHKRAIYTGTISSTFAIASVVGPLIGGALTEHATWRWCFYINLPIGGFAALLFVPFFRIHSDARERVPLKTKLKGLDGLGFLLFACSMTMLLLALQWGGVTYDWNSSIIIGLFVGCGAAFAPFVAWQIYMKDDALIPPRLFTVHRNAWLICASSFFVNGPFQVIIYWLPIWFQAVLGASPTQSGIKYFPTVIADAVAAFVGAGVIVQAVGWWNPFLLLAEALVCIGGGLLSTIYPEISSGHWIGYQILAGFGFSLAGNLAHLGMQASLPIELVPLGATTLLTIISTSCTIFTAIGQTIFQKRLMANLSVVVPPEVVQAIISAGATNLDSVVDPSVLSTVIREYGKSITQVFYVPAGAPVLSFVLVAFTKWTSTKKRPTSTKAEGEEEQK
ncbi:MFS general substrate transporter [Daldinia loculata]|uniref:MFS general substrate transporter n=1 Tax=Daldinia loculata TaxID=103429 RepID=UPI0020C49FC0|nr:MFS general substrate transporter [Daldinia loculata]KAI1652074.1 MFS general substrate transporter [Daldinia loculata]